MATPFAETNTSTGLTVIRATSTTSSSQANPITLRETAPVADSYITDLSTGVVYLDQDSAQHHTFRLGTNNDAISDVSEFNFSGETMILRPTGTANLGSEFIIDNGTLRIDENEEFRLIYSNSRFGAGTGEAESELLRGTGILIVGEGGRFIVDVEALPRSNTDGFSNIITLTNNDSATNLRMTVRAGTYNNDVNWPVLAAASSTSVGRITASNALQGRLTGGEFLQQYQLRWEIGTSVPVRDLMLEGNTVEFRPNINDWAAPTGGGFRATNNIGMKWFTTQPAAWNSGNALVFGNRDSTYLLQYEGRRSETPTLQDRGSNSDGYLTIAATGFTADRDIIFLNLDGMSLDGRLAVFNGGNANRIRIENHINPVFTVVDNNGDAVPGAEIDWNSRQPRYQGNGTTGSPARIDFPATAGFARISTGFTNDQGVLSLGATAGGAQAITTEAYVRQGGVPAGGNNVDVGVTSTVYVANGSAANFGAHYASFTDHTYSVFRTGKLILFEQDPGLGVSNFLDVDNGLRRGRPTFDNFVLREDENLTTVVRDNTVTTTVGGSSTFAAPAGTQLGDDVEVYFNGVRTTNFSGDVISNGTQIQILGSGGTPANITSGITQSIAFVTYSFPDFVSTLDDLYDVSHRYGVFNKLNNPASVNGTELDFGSSNITFTTSTSAPAIAYNLTTDTYTIRVAANGVVNQGENFTSLATTGTLTHTDTTLQFGFNGGNFNQGTLIYGTDAATAPTQLFADNIEVVGGISLPSLATPFTVPTTVDWENTRISRRSGGGSGTVTINYDFFGTPQSQAPPAARILANVVVRVTPITKRFIIPATLRNGYFGVRDATANTNLKAVAEITATESSYTYDLEAANYTSGNQLLFYWRPNSTIDNGYYTTIFSFQETVLDNVEVTLPIAVIPNTLWQDQIESVRGDRTSVASTARVTVVAGEAAHNVNSVVRAELRYADTGVDRYFVGDANAGARVLMETILGLNGSSVYVETMMNNEITVDFVAPGNGETVVDGRFAYLDTTAPTIQAVVTAVVNRDTATDITPVFLTGITGGRTIIIVPNPMGATPTEIAVALESTTMATDVMDIKNGAGFLVGNRLGNKGTVPFSNTNRTYGNALENN